jgi:hypothetical protein
MGLLKQKVIMEIPVKHCSSDHTIEAALGAMRAIALTLAALIADCPVNASESHVCKIAWRERYGWK